MSKTKGIKDSIKSAESMRKFSKAMEMVATSKLKNAQRKMESAKPYCDLITDIISSIGKSYDDNMNPYLFGNANPGKAEGIIVVTTDKGLCGSLNTALISSAYNYKLKVEQEGGNIIAVFLGKKGSSLLPALGFNILSKLENLGEQPNMPSLIAAIQPLLKQYMSGKLSKISLFYNEFVSSIKQTINNKIMLPISFDNTKPEPKFRLYEPDYKSVMDLLIKRYIESQMVFSVATNMAAEQGARMMSMRAASDNALEIIKDLKITYNKTRQAAITTEITEIISGAEAVG